MGDASCSPGTRPRTSSPPVEGRGLLLIAWLPLCVKGSRKASDLSIFHLEFQGRRAPENEKRSRQQQENPERSGVEPLGNRQPTGQRAD